MPKKTKREKILAQARRIIREQSADEQPNTATSSLYSFKPVSNQTTIPKQISDDSREYAYIRKDLIKTVIISAAAVIIEIILYSSIK